MYPIDFFLRAAQRYPDRVALRGPGTRCMSFAELADRVNALACAMQACDPSEQSRVAICAGNHADHVVALLATLAAGKIWVPLNVRSTAIEIDRILNSVKPTIVIVDEKGSQLVHGSEGVTCWGMGQKDLLSVARLCQDYAGSTRLAITTGRDGTQAIKFTGGTTGAPKGVMQPYRAWNACIINQIHGWKLTEDDCYVVCAPVTHGTSTYVLPVLAQGGCLAFPEQNSPSEISKAFVQHRGTISFMPPTLIYMLMSDPGVKQEDFAKLRHLVFGGAPMPPEKVDEAIAFFGPRVGATYGQTEAPQIVTMIRPNELADPVNRGSCGVCTWLSEMAIMSPQGEFLPVGEKGEVVVRGDLVMTGYCQMPEKTAETIVNGWLHTGDVGYVDERGYLYIKDRVRDVVITGGFNVYPVDVEDALSKHPAIYEACVFGLPHDKWGEAVHAAVQLKPGQNVTDVELMNHVKGLLGGVHTPKQIHFLEQLPRSAVGKVLKKDVREQLASRSTQF
ncbi:MAG: AMP-binding protein [Burkholderiaceae bacterium]|nr:AMP-binding protein [Burkholderiaceae bacterium]